MTSISWRLKQARSQFMEEREPLLRLPDRGTLDATLVRRADRWCCSRAVFATKNIGHPRRSSCRWAGTCNPGCRSSPYCSTVSQLKVVSSDEINSKRSWGCQAPFSSACVCACMPACAGVGTQQGLKANVLAEMFVDRATSYTKAEIGFCRWRLELGSVIPLAVGRLGDHYSSSSCCLVMSSSVLAAAFQLWTMMMILNICSSSYESHAPRCPRLEAPHRLQANETSASKTARLGFDGLVA